MKKVYIILSRSNTAMALAIRRVTKRFYNHSSIAFEPTLDTMYSFGRLYPRFMLPAGFVTEHRNRGFYALHPDIPICIIEKDVTDDEYSIIRGRILPFLATPARYKYDIIHAPFVASEREYEVKDKYVCSVFIAQLLNGVVEFDKDYTHIQPEDFLKIGGRIIYEGKIKDYKYEKQ